MIANIIFIIGNFIFIKNINTYIMHGIILYKISKYNKKGYNNPYINYYVRMEHYLKTFFRIWDWGYKNILPKKDFEKIILKK